MNVQGLLALPPFYLRIFTYKIVALVAALTKNALACSIQLWKLELSDGLRILAYFMLQLVVRSHR